MSDDLIEQLLARAFAIQHTAAPETIRLLRVSAARIAELEKQLASVLQREADTHARHDEKFAELERQLAEAREVKPLEWDDWGTGHRIVLAATSPAGLYRITQRFFPENMFTLEKANNDAASYPTLEAAKAAAQADYAARILSALKEPKP